MREALYFAYGSNLKLERMRARVPSARVSGRARLPDRRLSFDKLGRDGTGKANCVPHAGETVWGVLYRLDPAHWAGLDDCELGYERVSVAVLDEADEVVVAWTYEARQLTSDPVPLPGYKRLVVEGGREHGLPEDYVVRIERAPDRAD